MSGQRRDEKARQGEACDGRKSAVSNHAISKWARGLHGAKINKREENHVDCCGCGGSTHLLAIDELVPAQEFDTNVRVHHQICDANHEYPEVLLHSISAHSYLGVSSGLHEATA